MRSLSSVSLSFGLAGDRVTATYTTILEDGAGVQLPGTIHTESAIDIAQLDEDDKQQVVAALRSLTDTLSKQSITTKHDV